MLQTMSSATTRAAGAPLIASLLVLLGTPTAASQTERDVRGRWEGTILIPGQPLVVKIDLEPNEDSWSGTIDIPAQGASGLPLVDVTVNGDDLQFTIQDVPGAPTFAGAFADGVISGEFRQGPARFPFELGREPVEDAGPHRPQTPKPPFPYDVEEVSYRNGGVTIAGTLTLPPGDERAPAALLISGSGAMNRDLELLGHKTFLLLADHLTRLGIAVLRVDDRGVGGSTGSTLDSTSLDKAEDVVAGVRFLRGHSRIDPDRVGLIGISEGGLVAPLAVNRTPPGDVAFVVLLAGPGVPGADVLRAQLRRIAAANGASEEEIEQLAALQEQALELLSSDLSPDEMTERMIEVAMKQAQLAPETANLDSEDIRAAAEASVAPQTGAWFRFFVSYDPGPALGGLSVPVLAMNGELDTQVDVDQNLSAIQAALATSGNNDVTILRMPGLNHLFQTARTGSPAEYGTIEETMAPEALQTISDWILERFDG